MDFRVTIQRGMQGPIGASPLPQHRKTVEPSEAGEKLSTRGARRRQDLIDAALRIIARDGPQAVTLRTVNAEAKAAHGSITYYFGGRDELIRAALEHVAAENTKALSAAWPTDAPPKSAADLAALISQHVMHQMIEDRAMGITILELHLAVARDPALAPALEAWGRAYNAIARDSLRMLGSKAPEADAALLVNMINGLIMRQLAVQRADFENRVLRPAILRVLETITRD